MKFRHIVLFGIVASIMAYLNNTLEEEKTDDKQESILDELKELIDNKFEDIDIEKKLEEIKEKAPEQLKEASETVKDVTDNLIEELNSIVTTLEDIASAAIEELDSDECENEKESEAIKESVLSEENEAVSQPLEVEKTEDLISEIEELMASLDAKDETSEEETLDEPVLENETEVAEEETADETVDDEVSADKELEDFDEEDYLAKIKEAIDSTIALDENGEVADMSEVLNEEDERKEITRDEIDEIFSEILKQEGLMSEEENSEEPEEVEPEETTEEEYLDELKEDLKEELEEKAQEEIVNEAPEADIYAKINELYPYLSRGFVRAVYDLKESIANEYPLDQRIVILHRLSFKDINHLRQFSDIVLNHDYRVNVDENKMIVDIFKDMINTDGKILTNIFEIANQARVLDGNYEGYRVETL